MTALGVAVLGAGGTIAPAIVRDLAESEEVSDLLLLDLDEARASSVASNQGGGKARPRGVDARDHYELRGALADTDVLVNSASYRVNLEAMRACLDARCHYVDLGGLYHVTADQLTLDADFHEAGLLALLGMGSSPGKTNVMAAWAVAQLGEAPESIDVIAAGRDPAPAEGFRVPYALRTLLDELTLPPMVVRAGQAQEIAPLTVGGHHPFPDPIGEAETIYTLHSEVLTFPGSFGCRECSFRLSLSDDLLAKLRELTEAHDEEVERHAREAIPPSPETVSVHVVEARGESGATVSATAVTRPMQEWRLGGGVVSTAAPAAASVRLLARGRLSARGAMPPERCVHPDDLFPELAGRGCEFTIAREEAVTK